MLSILAIIPARAGSKRLPGKNLMPIAGLPLITWSIRAALGSRAVTKVLVSTEDEAIAALARSAGAQVPFLRPVELATDTASSESVILHALDHLAAGGETFDAILLLQPTSPFRTSEDIDRIIAFAEESQSDAMISVCETDHPPLWSNTLPQDRSMAGFLNSEIKSKRSQDIPQYYRLNGAMYFCITSIFRINHDFFLPSKVFAYIMPKERSVDIDTLDDLEFAEFLVWKGKIPIPA